MKNPLVSIVLCTYNGGKFIEEQIRSLISQTYQPIEIIIADDASNDNTVEILKKFKDEPQIKLLLNDTNVGVSKNFEFAIKNASGDYIALCDQDDIWLSRKVEEMFMAIGENFLVYSDSELINEDGLSIGKKISDLRRMYTGNKTTGFIFSNVVWGHAVFINRKLVEHIIPIPANIAHDIWIAFKAATLTGIKYLDLPLTKYRQHETTVTTTIRRKTASRKSKERYLDFIDKLNWIMVMRDYERPEGKKFFSRLYDLYSKKSVGKFQWKLFFFLIRNRVDLFMFTKKKWTSQLIEIAKQSRGEKLS